MALFERRPDVFVVEEVFVEPIFDALCGQGYFPRNVTTCVERQEDTNRVRTAPGLPPMSSPKSKEY